MGFTAGITRSITYKIRYRAKVTWNVIRYHENETTASVIMALLLSTGYTCDLAISLFKLSNVDGH